LYSAIKADTKSKPDLALTSKTRHSDATGKNDYNRNSTCRQKRKLLQPLHSVNSAPQSDRNGLLLANGTVITHCHVRRVAPVGPVPPASGARRDCPRVTVHGSVRAPPPRNIAAKELAMTNSLEAATLWGGVGGGARGGKSSSIAVSRPSGP
jgi:hypothetical protein